MKTSIKIELEFAIEVSDFCKRKEEWQRGFNGSVSEFCSELSEFLESHPFIIGCKVTSNQEF
jgi:hypothetical protein